MTSRTLLYASVTGFSPTQNPKNNPKITSKRIYKTIKAQVLTHTRAFLFRTLYGLVLQSSRIDTNILIRGYILIEEYCLFAKLG